MSDLKSLFQPGSIAVVGASNNPLKAGATIIKNLVDMGYAGPIYPINAREAVVQGMKACPTICEVEGPIELLVLIMPAAAIFGVMQDLEKRMETRRDVRVIVCAASDFAEVDTDEGRARQDCLMKTAGRYGIRVVGPNCIGVIDTESGVNTTFVDNGLPPGTGVTRRNISFVSQSGSIAAMLLMLTASMPSPVVMNKFTSIGNMADVDFIDILEYYEQDEHTRVIGMYMEGYPRGRELIGVLERITRKKPVVVLKVGRSTAGASAASSHTGSLAGSDEIYEAAFRQAGVIRVDSVGELLDTLMALESLPLPRGGRTFIMSQTGGMGIFTTDEVSGYPWLRMSDLSAGGQQALSRAMPAMSSIGRVRGYADITVAANVAQHVEAMRIALTDPEIDSLIFLTVVPTFLSRPDLGQELARFFREEKLTREKPLFPVVLAGDYVGAVRADIERSGVYTFDMPERAVRALKNMVWYAEYRRRANG